MEKCKHEEKCRLRAECYGDCEPYTYRDGLAEGYAKGRKETLLRAAEIADNISNQYGDGDAISACDAISEAILKEAE